MKELRITVDDELYAELARRAADDNVEPDQYASQRLTTDLAHARFLEAAKAFGEEHGPAFAEAFGTGPARHAA
ncbi:hypothetical protein ABZT23_20095 [Streptomyces sp. NPDC005386]|uniref:hypothetical protein n=1 Tax=Streptomyces sp. NPDC005386 TaxID=3154562 RepID=UPI0033AD2B1C